MTSNLNGCLLPLISVLAALIPHMKSWSGIVYSEKYPEQPFTTRYLDIPVLESVETMPTFAMQCFRTRYSLRTGHSGYCRKGPPHHRASPPHKLVTGSLGCLQEDLITRGLDPLWLSTARRLEQPITRTPQSNHALDPPCRWRRP